MSLWQQISEIEIKDGWEMPTNHATYISLPTVYHTNVKYHSICMQYVVELGLELHHRDGLG